jgi:tRNA 2-thiouridine synthesizing protein B
MLIVVKYPPTRKISRDKISLAKEGDVVVLIQDAVLYALGDPILEEIKEKSVEVYALKEDFEARGYSEDMSAVDLITYGDFIDLLVEKGEKTVG